MKPPDRSPILLNVIMPDEHAAGDGDEDEPPVVAERGGQHLGRSDVGAGQGQDHQ